MEISFKKWLKENATSTSCIATFAMPVGTFNDFSIKKNKKSSSKLTKVKNKK